MEKSKRKKYKNVTETGLAVLFLRDDLAEDVDLDTARPRLPFSVIANEWQSLWQGPAPVDFESTSGGACGALIRTTVNHSI